MKRLILCLCALPALALTLASCGLSVGDAASAGATVVDNVGVSAPVVAADRTVLDEQAITGVELAYKAARLTIETGVDAGLIKGATATRVAALDNQAFLALGIARGAYRTGNAANYKAAVAEAGGAVAEILSLIRKPGG